MAVSELYSSVCNSRLRDVTQGVWRPELYTSNAGHPWPCYVGGAGPACIVDGV